MTTINKINISGTDYDIESKLYKHKIILNVTMENGSKNIIYLNLLSSTNENLYDDNIHDVKLKRVIDCLPLYTDDPNYENNIYHMYKIISSTSASDTLKNCSFFGKNTLENRTAANFYQFGRGNATSKTIKSIDSATEQIDIF